MRLYKIELDGKKAYLTRMFQGELLITSIDPHDPHAYNLRTHTTPLAEARDAIRRGIRNRRREARVVCDILLNREPNQFYKMLKTKKVRVLNKSKTPKNGQKYVGVEIEFLSDMSQHSIKECLIDAGLEEHVNLTTDSSIRGEDDCDGSCISDNCECYYCHGECVNDNCRGTLDHCNQIECDCEDSEDSGLCDGHECPGTHECPGDHECSCECQCDRSGGHELRVIATQKQINAVIKKVSNVLINNCDAKVNSSCGLHVHLDMRNRDVEKSFHNLVMTQPLLYSMVPKSRRTGTYSQPTKLTPFKSATKDRYLGINPNSYREHKTIEVRLHSGTVCSTKINNWINLLVSIVDHDKTINKIKTISGVSRRLKLSKNLTSYIYKRATKFQCEFTFDSKHIPF